MQDGRQQKQPWKFWVDRGGTFTDIVARNPAGELVVEKLLSDNPQQYKDAAVHGIRRLLTHAAADDQPASIEEVRIGTTVATNALLERQGEPTLLVITGGFKDALVIANQNRPDLFKRHIRRPQPLYDQVIEARERVSAQGDILTPLAEDELRDQLQLAFDSGLRSCAIVFIHGFHFHQHELIAAQLAKTIGFTQISVSHQISGLIKLIGRGDTSVVDAYLSPILRRYVDRVDGELAALAETGPGQQRLQFMQSSGGLTDARRFRGKDAILSGPAGGVVAMVETAKQAGFEQIIGFDMGGTSTDVSLYNGQYERTWESEVAGVRLRSPMMKVHTVAAGGGSILSFDGRRLLVGPESAGAAPGPACYRNGGPLAVTDINVILGKIQPDLFPAIFGEQGTDMLDHQAAQDAFWQLAEQINQKLDKEFSCEQLAAGYLRIAVEHMANAIKQISIQRGHDTSRYLLSCFGGAAGQHACLVADALGIETIFIHQLSGVLSAYGMGLADVRSLKQQSVELRLAPANDTLLVDKINQLSQVVREELLAQDIAADHIEIHCRLLLRYQGSDTSIAVNYQAGADGQAQMADDFSQQHQRLYGFTQQDQTLIISTIEVEAIARGQTLAVASDAKPPVTAEATPFDRRRVYMNDGWQQTPFYQRQALPAGARCQGPAVIIDHSTTVVVEPGWQAEITAQQQLLITRYLPREDKEDVSLSADPVMLEVFNNLFMHIAKEMGLALQHSAVSVNIKERLDFSCALFDCEGELVANAPHMPVHLGSMGESVKSILRQNSQTSPGDLIRPGDSFLINSPYHGGTHLPDLTVITPYFEPTDSETKGDTPRLLFFIASRGHHADIGGISPGSMPAHSHNIGEEGILFDNFLLVREGVLQEEALLDHLGQGPFPARNVHYNLADLKAQLAANQKGLAELDKMLVDFGIEVVRAYMGHVQDAAEHSVRQAIGRLTDGEFCYPLDNGSEVRVRVSVDRKNGRAVVDFSGSSPQQDNNFNAPLAVCKAAVLYVFRTLVDDNIPMNAGCLRPVEIIVPTGSMLNPAHPAAVVAGNVETSQVITDALYGALGVMAGAQGTMNNLTFGNAKYQYYETLCGGSGAGPDHPGCDAVHTHMTNSRLTDPEVLELRYPVLLKRFEIRPDSGGEGQYRGGHGVVRELCFREPMSASILSNRRIVPPFGLVGGEPGQCGENWLVRSSGQREPLAGSDTAELNAGDCLIIRTPGGGGYGE